MYKANCCKKRSRPNYFTDRPLNANSLWSR